MAAEKRKYPETLNFTYEEGEAELHAFCFKMGESIHVYVYDETPKMGSLVAKPYSPYPDQPMILFEGHHLPEAISLSQILSGRLKRGVFVSANFENQRVPLLDFAQKLSEVIKSKFNVTDNTDN